MPRELRPAIDLLDEIWVASDFVAQTIAVETDKPVLTFPLPVIAPEPPTLTRSELGIPDDRFVFLFVFDFFSTLERKNPLGLVEAFTRAFPEPGHAASLPEEHQRRPRPRQSAAAAGGDRRPTGHRALRRLRQRRAAGFADRGCATATSRSTAARASA